MLRFSSVQLTKLRHSCPRPLWWKTRKVGDVGTRWFFIFTFSSPLRTTLGEDVFQELAGWIDVGMLIAPVFGEPAFDGGFENGSFVAFEVGLDALKVGDGFVEAGELLFDILDDSILLFTGWNWQREASKISS